MQRAIRTPVEVEIGLKLPDPLGMFILYMFMLEREQDEGVRQLLKWRVENLVTDGEWAEC